MLLCLLIFSEDVERQHFETNISPESAPLYDDEALPEDILETEALPEARLEIETLPVARRLSYDNPDVSDPDSDVTFLNPKSNICTSCDDNNEAKFNCKECEDTLCNLCHDAHLKVKLTRNHTITPLHRVSSPPSSSSSLPPGQMEFIIRRKVSAGLLSSSDSD